MNLKKIMRKKKALRLVLSFHLPNYFFITLTKFLLPDSNLLTKIDYTVVEGQLKYKKKRIINVLQLINTIRYKQKKEIRRYLDILIFSYYFFKTSLKLNMALFIADAETLESNFQEFTPLTPLYYTKIKMIPFLFEQRHFSENQISLYLEISLYKFFYKIYQDTQIFKKLFYYFFKKNEHPRIKLKRQFPSINIAFRFKISKYVIY